MSFPPWESLGLSNLFLKNDDISSIPQLVVPEGYELIGTPLEESEHEQLASCLSKAFGIQHGVWEASRIPKEFLEEKTVAKTFRLLHGKEDGSTTIAATASLRIIPDKYPGSGYMHWVAVHPGHQGRGLGTVVAIAVLLEARDVQGCATCVLETQDTSLPAIVTYERLGFHPVHTDDTHADRWVAIRANMKPKTSAETTA
jgi:mycothiol synthase